MLLFIDQGNVEAEYIYKTMEIVLGLQPHEVF